jgi:hypothetical protein
MWMCACTLYDTRSESDFSGASRVQTIKFQ